MRVLVALGGNALLKRGEPMTAEAQRANVRVAARALAAEKGWDFKADGEYLRRVVPSPEPKRIFEIRPIRWLLDQGTVVICAGGGGIPTMWMPGQGRTLGGVEAVIDKDLASELLAREIEADLFVMATDVDGVYAGWGTPDQRRLDEVTPAELRAMDFASGSMGPKVDAAARFVEATGKRAAIGALHDIEKIVDGAAGTNVVAGPVRVTA
jgi:carbamate kinase